jgi:hypothetical protein
MPARRAANPSIVGRSILERAVITPICPVNAQQIAEDLAQPSRFDRASSKRVLPCGMASVILYSIVLFDAKRTDHSVL